MLNIRHHDNAIKTDVGEHPGCSTTSVHSLTSYSAGPGCPLSNHPKYSHQASLAASRMQLTCRRERVDRLKYYLVRLISADSQFFRKLVKTGAAVFRRRSRSLDDMDTALRRMEPHPSITLRTLRTWDRRMVTPIARDSTARIPGLHRRAVASRHHGRCSSHAALLRLQCVAGWCSSRCSGRLVTVPLVTGPVHPTIVRGVVQPTVILIHYPFKCPIRPWLGQSQQTRS